MSVTKFGDWNKALAALSQASEKMQEALRKTVLQEAHFLRSRIVEGFREQAPGGATWLPVSERTLAIRRFKGFKGTKALVVRGDLRNSIAVVELPEGVFIGVARNARGADGKDLINIADIHENGAGPYVIRITEKMRRFLHAAFAAAGLEAPKGKPSTGIIITKIPARPFIAPVWKAHCEPISKLEDRLVRRLAQNLGGKYGTAGAPPPTK